MTRHHILCIHGIGKHENEWVKTLDDGEESFQTLFARLWEKYKLPLKRDFEEAVEIHSIHYDDEINKLFGSWKEQSQQLKAAFASSPILLDEVDWFTETIDKAEQASSDADWQYTHLFDLILFTGSPSIRTGLSTTSDDRLSRSSTNIPVPTSR